MSDGVIKEIPIQEQLKSTSTDIFKEPPKSIGEKEKDLIREIQKQKESSSPDKQLEAILEDRPVQKESPKKSEGIELSFKRLNANITELSEQIESGKGDVKEARRLLGSLLKARERLYFHAAQAINPNIQEIERSQGLYKIAGTNIYGSIISILDATPVLKVHKHLVDKLRLRLNNKGKEIIGERLPPKPLLESSIVFSGSSAQDRVQFYPGDIDLAEYVRLNASTPEIVSDILARSIQEGFSETIIITTPNGEHMTLHFSDMKLGQYAETDISPNPDLKEESMHHWTTGEIKAGKKTVKTIDGSRILTLQEACLSPGFFKIDYIGVTDDSVREVTKVVIIQASSDNGEVILTNDPGQAGAMQEVYFDNPSGFDLVEATRDPDKFIKYRSAMKREIKRYSKSDHMNGLKVLKRLYNLSKVEGDLALSQEIGQMFNTDTAHISQLADRLRVCQSARRQGIEVSVQQETIIEQLRKFLSKSLNPSAVEALAIIESENFEQTFDQLDGKIMTLINSEYQEYLKIHPKIADKIKTILDN